MKTICTIFVALLFSTFLVSCSKDDDAEPAMELVTAQLFEDTSIMENSPTVELRINLDKPAPAAGFIILGVSIIDDAAFQTNPPVIDGEIEIPVQKGANFAKFQFSPQDNDLLQETGLVLLELLDSSEEIIFGSKRSSSIEIIEDEAAVSASFDAGLAVTVENNVQGVSVRIMFSAPAPGEGSLVIQLEGNDDDYFVSTQPALNAEQKILVPIESGMLFTTFQVYPKDNALLENHKTLNLNIIETNGVVIKGTLFQKELLLLDDEIQGRIKTVETITTDGRRNKKTWEYATDGKVDKVLWEQEPATLISGTDHYYYSNGGMLQSVALTPGDSEDFTWQDGKITLSEIVSGFSKMGYSIYDYNPAGNIQKKTTYSYKTGGSFPPSVKFEYEYFSDGNLKKESKYVFDNETWVFDSSLALDSYTDKTNPAPI